MNVERLELDYLRTRRAPGWASWLLFAAALAFATDLAITWRTLNTQIARMEARLAAVPRSSTTAAVPARAPDAEEVAFARETIRRLATPWERLFAALESAQSERVALLAIEPDAEAGTVTVNAEARDYFAALSYVANLEEARTLKDVRLVRHETARGGAQRPLAFTVQANWREGP